MRFGVGYVFNSDFNVTVIVMVRFKCRFKRTTCICAYRMKLYSSALLEGNHESRKRDVAKYELRADLC